MREHITLGYAVTVHSAQGVTADTTHAVLGETTTRALLYVAMTRGRDTNTAYLYERATGDHEYGEQELDGTHVKHRGDSREAAALVRGILTNFDQLAVTAHEYGVLAPGTALPGRVRRLLDRRAAATKRRGVTYQSLQRASAAFVAAMARGRGQAAERAASIDDGLEL